jgi:hypothetical protein
MDEERKSLDELLDEQNEAQAQPEPAPVEQAAETADAQAARLRDENGRFAKKDDDGGTSPPAENEFDGKATLAERRKRQEAEQRLEALEQELQALRNPPPPPPNLFEDEQGWQQHFGGQVVSTAVQHASMNATLNMSEMLARREHDDFDDMKAAFLELAQQNPTLREQALADPDPWAKAYSIAKTHRTMTDLGAVDVDGLKEQLRQEVLAEMQGQAPARPGLPPTLSTERNLGSRSGPQWAGHKTLDELLSG